MRRDRFGTRGPAAGRRSRLRYPDLLRGIALIRKVQRNEAKKYFRSLARDVLRGEDPLPSDAFLYEDSD